METQPDAEEHLCPICLDKILPTDGQALTECCHNVFHLSCMILSYIRRENDKTKCPMCRGNICSQMHTELEPELHMINDFIDFADNSSSPHP
jgi:hypothetical protein